MKQKIVDLLMETKREGMGMLVEYMIQSGFFETPCSTRYHLAKKGGLAEHALNITGL